MNSRYNAVPVIVQQIVEDIQSPKTPANVRFNKIVVLETIKDYCEKVINEYRREEQKKKLKNFR